MYWVLEYGHVALFRVQCTVYSIHIQTFSMYVCIHMAGCKSGKNVVEIRRSGTKRQKNLNLVNEPMEHKKKWRAAFRALVIRQ
jgi:hypothetical protein